MDCPRCGDEMVVGDAKSYDTSYFCGRCRTKVYVINDGKSYPRRGTKVTSKEALGFFKEANKTLKILMPKKRSGRK